MTLTPNFLPVGSVVEYNIGTTDKPEWSATTLDAVDLQWLDGDPEEFNIAHRPIPLTPEILMEWCGLIKNSDNSPYDYSNKDCSFCICENSGYFKIATAIENVGKQFNMLHQLQLAYLVHTQTVLPITIK